MSHIGHGKLGSQLVSVQSQTPFAPIPNSPNPWEGPPASEGESGCGDAEHTHPADGKGACPLVLGTVDIWERWPDPQGAPRLAQEAVRTHVEPSAGATDQRWMKGLPVTYAP